MLRGRRELAARGRLAPKFVLIGVLAVDEDTIGEVAAYDDDEEKDDDDGNTTEPSLSPEVEDPEDDFDDDEASPVVAGIETVTSENVPPGVVEELDNPLPRTPIAALTRSPAVHTSGTAMQSGHTKFGSKASLLGPSCVAFQQSPLYGGCALTDRLGIYNAQA